MFRSMIVVLLLIGIPSAAIPCISAGLRMGNRAQEAAPALPVPVAAPGAALEGTAPQAMAAEHDASPCRDGSAELL